MFIILTLYCAHNPAVFGGMAWEEYPTLRSFMEMCITNQFVFPPPSYGDSGDNGDAAIKAADAATLAAERRAILQLERHLAAATGNKDSITEANSLLLDTLVSMDPKGPVRRPPQQVLDQLQQINQHCKIGHLLCRSRSPDFLLDILNRQASGTQSSSMPWLADLVESSEGSLGVLPVQCLCEFLLTSQSAEDDDQEDNDDHGEDGGEGNSKEKKKTKRRKERQLLLHLQNLLQAPDSDRRACCETLDYFLRRLSSQQTRQRLQALRGLRLVLTPIQEDEETSGMKPEQKGVRKDDRWLLEHLPSLPCFAEFYPHISTALRHGCQVENDPSTVGLYLQFLVRYAPESTADLADLCLDMSSIIVERSTILPAILPGPQRRADTETAAATHRALLELFTGYMRRLLELGAAGSEAAVNPEHRAESVTVIFRALNKEASLHFFVVHAQIILLTFIPPQELRQNQELHSNLLSWWFGSPNAPVAPAAYLLTTKEEAVLIPDWLKLKMIRSDCPVLVDTALRQLDAHQLVLFIQSFGIPVDSMTKLLGALDAAAASDPAAVAEAVMDKTYMGQLVAVQHRRGAGNGHHFASALGLRLGAYAAAKTEAEKAAEEESVSALARKETPSAPPRSTAMIPPAQCKSTLMHLFDVGSPSRMTLKEKRDAFRTLQKFLVAEISSSTSSGGATASSPMLDATVKALDQILRSEHKANFALAMLRRTPFSCALIRLLSTALSR